jgi:Thrombospondin type 3 repeat
MSRRSPGIAAAVLLGSFATCWAQSPSVDVGFVTIADTQTPIPGGVGNFTAFFYHSIDSSGVAFVGSGSSVPGSQKGVYLWSGGMLQRIADRSMQAPGTGFNFADFEDVSIEDGSVAFHAFAPSSGVFLWRDQVLSRVAGSGTPIPGGGGNFTTTEGKTPLSGGQVVYWGSDGAGQFGVFRWSAGSTEILVRDDFIIPEAGVPFRYINGDSLAMRDGSSVAFTGIGTDEIYGLYRFQNGLVRTVADGRGTLPDRRGNKQVGFFFGGPAIDGDTLIFVARDTGLANGRSALYRDDEDALSVLLQTPVPMPGGGFIYDLQEPGISNGRVAFWGIGSHPMEEGIFTIADGRLDKVIALGDPLGGSIVVDLFVYSVENISSAAIVFTATLANGVKGIYRANLTPIDPARDLDDDGATDLLDNCPAHANSSQTDTDADGFGDACDLCVSIANPEQIDRDNDGYGNRCDADLDGSAMVNAADLAAFRQRYGTRDAAADFNGDGFVGAADLAIFRSLFGKPPGPSGNAPAP